MRGDMQRRGFLKFLGAGVATAVLAVHMKLGDLAPVPETTTESMWDLEHAVTIANPSMFATGDVVKVDGEVMVVTAFDVENGVITVERQGRRKLFGVSV